MPHPKLHGVRLSRRESLLFEAGVKLGGIFHQYLGMPVSRRTAAGLSRTIERAVALQPYVDRVSVVVRPERGGPFGSGRFAYRYLTPPMLDVTVVLRDGAASVTARLRHRPDLRYPLMSVERVQDEGRRSPPASARTRRKPRKVRTGVGRGAG